ncbi:hypothetical protein [Rhizobium mesosinicum]|uniref:hypothetical protein n=1 Tax=Rhizobium mesosinicum TaxID=335017 RepID=UPI001C9E976C|nr:hypothetical protein [Rhizobium mesosinicum]
MNTVLKAFLFTLVTGAAAMPSVAHAQVELRLGPGGVEMRNPDRDRYADPDDDYGPRRRCDPRDALDNARDAGLRRPRIIGETRRSITVEGFTRSGRLERIRFANVRGCPET